MDGFYYEYFEMALRLLAAVVLGGIIGYERAENNHDAGLRTHILVCLGSATVMVISDHIARAAGFQSDVMRMGAQVISGIGFLGIGCIITNGDKVRGLTTAAGLWTTASVGLAVGIGYYSIAITVVVLMFITMVFMRPLTVKLKSREITIYLKAKSRADISNAIEFLNNNDVIVLSVKIKEKEEHVKAVVYAQLSKTDQQKHLMGGISEISGILEIN